MPALPLRAKSAPNRQSHFDIQVEKVAWGQSPAESYRSILV
ncbi:Uncharacterised protein [Vibrio cholerae]|nr:Uncharacterised protein [Vibrio cholerae]